METLILPCIPINLAAIKTAANLLKKGELVAFPTETVYGLGSPVFNEQAVKKIFEVKGRQPDNPLIIHIGRLDDMPKVAEKLPSTFDLLSKAFFPGPLTLVVPKAKNVPPVVSAGLHTVAVRMPSHPVALELIKQTGQPLVAPSANLSGKPSPTTASHVYDDLHGKIAAILDVGACEIGIESTVLDITTSPPTLLRQGKITQQDIESALGYQISLHDGNYDGNLKNEVRSPGMKYVHYAPKATIHLAYSKDETVKVVRQSKKPALLLSNFTFDNLPQHPLNAKTLYAEFRNADKNKTASVVIFVDETVKQDKGLLDRIIKASGKTTKL